MRLEITIEGGRPFHYPIDKECLVIGSSRSSDIKIEHMHVSRKHLAIHSSGGKFYIEDLGSTNGSFVDEERLEISTKKEFTTFFPVRLGSMVYVSLVAGDDENESLSAPGIGLASTGATIQTSPKIVIEEPKIPKTSEIPQKINRKKKEEKSKPVMAWIIMLLVLVGAGIGSYFFFNDELEQVSVSTSDAQVEEKPKVIEVAKKPLEYDFSDDDFIQRAPMETMLVRVKCVSEREKLLCDSVKGANHDSWGATMIDDQMVILADGTQFYDEAKKVVKEPAQIQNGTASVAQIESYHESLWKLATVYFLKSSIGEKFPFNEFDDEMLIFGLFYKGERGYKLGIEIVTFGGLIKEAKPLMDDSISTKVIENGVSALDVFKKYYRTKGNDL